MHRFDLNDANFSTLSVLINMIFFFKSRSSDSYFIAIKMCSMSQLGLALGDDGNNICRTRSSVGIGWLKWVRQSEVKWFQEREGERKRKKATKKAFMMAIKSQSIKDTINVHYMLLHDV